MKEYTKIKDTWLLGIIITSVFLGAIITILTMLLENKPYVCFS